MKTKVLLLPLLLFLLSCCGEAEPEYKIEQVYDSEYTDGKMVYQVKTSIDRVKDDPNSTKDDVESVYVSIINDIESESIDSVMLHEKSLAKMRVSEFKHLDDLSSAGEED